MEKIVIGHRTATRVLAVVPAVVVVMSVRALTIVQPPAAVRAAAAAVVAVACWWAYRLLTARVVIAETGVHVRGVFYEADITWTDLEQVTVVPAGQALQFLLLGIMRPYAMALRAGNRTLHPIAAVSVDDDDDISRAVRAMRTRAAGWHLPTQRESQESVTRV